MFVEHNTTLESARSKIVTNIQKEVVVSTEILPNVNLFISHIKPLNHEYNFVTYSKSTFVIHQNIFTNNQALMKLFYLKLI